MSQPNTSLCVFAPTAGLFVLLVSLGGFVAGADTKPEQLKDVYGDPLPAQAKLRLGTLRFRDRGTLCCSALSPDGKLVLTAGRSGSGVRLWNTTSGLEIRHLISERGVLVPFCALFSADGKKAAVAGLQDEHGIPFWNVETGRCDSIPSVGIEIQAAAFSPDGQFLAAGGGRNENNLTIWDVRKRSAHFNLKGHDRFVYGVAFSPDGKLLASGGGQYYLNQDNEIRLWDATTGKEIARLEGQKDAILSLRFSPDGKTLAAGSLDKHVYLWEVATKKQRHKLALKQGVFSLAFSHDGKLLAAGGGTSITLWDSATAKPVRTIPVRGSNIASLSFTPDDNTLVVCNSTNTIQRRRVADGEEIGALPAHSDGIRGILFTPDDGRVVTLGGDNSIRFWDAKTGRQTCVLECGDPQGCFISDPNVTYGNPLAISPDGKTLAIWHRLDSDDTLQLWDVTGGKLRCRLSDSVPVRTSVNFSLDGKLVVAAGGFGVRLWDINGWKALGTIGPNDPHRKTKAMQKWAGFLPEGRTIVVGSNELGIRLLDRYTGETLGRFEAKHHSAEWMALSPDGRLLATVIMEGSVGALGLMHVWEVATGRLLCTIKAGDPEKPSPDLHQGKVVHIAFSPDGRMLASAGIADKTARVWDVATGKQLAKFEGHRSGVTCVAFSPDGKTLASGGQDTTGLLWDVSKLAPLSPRTPLDEKALDELWDRLRTTDTVVACRTIDALSRGGDEVVRRIADRVRPLKPPEKTDVEKWIRDLDARAFAVRQKAVGSLARSGELVEAELRAALKADPPMQARLHLESLLAEVRPWVRDPESLRALRAIYVLERIGSPEAVKLLDTLAGGADDARFTREAKAARERGKLRRSLSAPGR